MAKKDGLLLWVGLKKEKAVKSAYDKLEFSTLMKVHSYISVFEKFDSMILHNLDNYIMSNEWLAGCIIFIGE